MTLFKLLSRFYTKLWIQSVIIKKFQKNIFKFCIFIIKAIYFNRYSICKTKRAWGKYTFKILVILFKLC